MGVAIIFLCISFRRSGCCGLWGCSWKWRRVCL